MWLTCQSNVDVLGSGVIRCKPINHSIWNSQFITTEAIHSAQQSAAHALDVQQVRYGVGCRVKNECD